MGYKTDYKKTNNNDKEWLASQSCYTETTSHNCFASSCFAYQPQIKATDAYVCNSKLSVNS